jgi:hypothetical protein
MAETAAHLVDHVLPPLPVRQWVLAVPKRLRYFLHRGRRSQRPMYSGKPTLQIEASQHRIGIVLIGTQKFRMPLPSLVHSFPAIETGDHAECRHWGMVNFGYAAGTAIGEALSMRFDRRLAELNWRSNGWNSIYQGGKFRQDPLLAHSGHKSARNCSARHQPFSS